MSEPESLTEAEIRADERRKVAQELRDVVAEQASWLWFEVGESALSKVAAYIAPPAIQLDSGDVVDEPEQCPDPSAQRFTAVEPGWYQIRGAI